MKHLVKTISSAIFSIWFLGFFVATPLFNWRFATQSGFWTWLCFGEIVPTFQAAAWPYFAYQTVHSPQVKTDVESLEHFKKSRDAIGKALEIILQPNNQNPVSGSEEMAALQYLKTAVSEARCVREEYLRRVNPDMPSRYRNGYINSINGLIDATTERNETKLMKSAMVFNEYEKWESNLLKP